MGPLQKVVSIVLVLLALILFIFWLPFFAGHPTVSETPGVLILFFAPIISVALSWFARKIWLRSKQST